MEAAITTDKQRAIGVGLILVSATVFSTGGLFIKGVSADSWSIIFWRSLFAALFMIGFTGFHGKWRSEFVGMGWTGIVAGFVGALATTVFIPAFKYTTIANVSLIYAAAPFVAAFFAWLWMRERPTLPVIFGSVLALAGVAIIMSGSLGSLNIKGDLLALLMTFGMALWMVIYRRYPNTPSTGPMVLMCAFLMMFALVFGKPFDAIPHEIPIIATFGLVFSVASVTLAEGAKRLPSGEVALISALETPLAPIWAVLMFSEWPNMLAVFGGLIVMVAVLGSQLANMRRGDGNS